MCRLDIIGDNRVTGFDQMPAHWRADIPNSNESKLHDGSPGGNAEGEIPYAAVWYTPPPGAASVGVFGSSYRAS
jgi:hypothetical protein